MSIVSNIFSIYRISPFFLAVYLIAGCDPVATNQVSAPEEPEDASFSAQVAALVPQFLDKENIPGAAIAIMKGGEITWVKGFGLADLSSGTAMTGDHIFNAASISKAVTAWGIMKLVEAGKIDLDAPVNQYLKRWRLLDRDWPAKDVSVRRLLSHSGGISMPSVPGFRWPLELPGVVNTLAGNYQKSTYAAAGTAAEIAFEPGRLFHYSGGGFVILQLVLEDVTGIPFADYMYQEVLKPLGMEDSQYGWDEKLSQKMATPYLSNRIEEDIFRFSGLAASALHTSARDLSRWMLAGSWTNHELRQAVISDRSLALMYTPVVETGSGGQELAKMGFAYFLEVAAGGQLYAVSHSGDNAGWSARILFNPVAGEGFVVLTNSDSGGKLIQALSCLWSSYQPRLRVGGHC